MTGFRKLSQWLVIFAVLLSLTAPIAAMSPLMASETAAQTDTDGDGLTDDAELGYGTDPYNPDTDGDELLDGEEVDIGTNPNSWDSDNDSLPDGQEVNYYFSDPLDSDSDDDGLTDGVEVGQYGTDPTRWDTDEDSLSDFQELMVTGTDPTFADTDGDGLMDADDRDPNPLEWDSDEDGISDGEEVLIYGTIPSLADTDGDGINDGAELLHPHGVLDPLNPDSDGDGVFDGADINPLVPDRDQDGVEDENDNCPDAANPDFEDSDGDGSGDACDDLPFGDEPWEYSLLDGYVTLTFPLKFQEGAPSASIAIPPDDLPGNFLPETATAFEISTTGSFDFPMKLCTTYSINFAHPEDAGLFHYAGGSWVEITGSNYPDGATLCGEADSPGIFAVAELELPSGSDLEIGSNVTYVDANHPNVIVSFAEVTASGRIDVEYLELPIVVPWDDPTGYLFSSDNHTTAWTIASTAQFTGAEICVSFDSRDSQGFGPPVLAIESGGTWRIGQIGEYGAFQVCVQTGNTLSDVLIGSLDTHPITISFVDEGGKKLIGELNSCISLEIIEAIFDYQEFGTCDVVDGSLKDGVLQAKFPAGTYSVHPDAIHGIQGVPGYVLHPDTVAATIIEASLTAPTYYVLEALAANTSGDGPVYFTDPETGVSISFSYLTGAGITSVTVDSNSPALPEGFALEGALFFDIETTAAFDGAAYVCLPYDPSAFANPESVKLLHFEEGAWVDVTDYDNWDSSFGEICGWVASFSPFAIAQSVDGSTNVHIITQGANGLPAPGAYVYVYSGASCEWDDLTFVADGYTDATGIFEVADVTPGGYCVQDAYPPAGYGNDPEPSVFVVVESGQTATVTFTYDYHPPDPAVYGLVRLHIRDGDGNAISSDSCATISPAQVDGQTTICDELPIQPSSGADGIIDIYVTDGGATLTSYQPPVMWQVSGSLPTVLVANPGEVIEHDIVLAPTGNGSVAVHAYKTGEAQVGVPGADFAITEAANCSGAGDVIGQVTTAFPPNGSSGEVASAFLELPPGDYCAEFVSAPAGAGFVIVERLPFTAIAGWQEMVQFGFQDTPPAHLRIIAEGASGIPAPGASFDVYSASDCDILQDYNGTIGTEGNGQGVYVNIAPGSYCIVHNDAPNGFDDVDPEAQLVTAVAGQTVEVAFTYGIHPPDPAIYGLVRLEVLTHLGDVYFDGDVCVTISPAQLNGVTTICDMDPSNPSDYPDGRIDIYVTASGTSIVSLPSPLLWKMHASSPLPMAISASPGDVVTQQITIEPTGQGLLNIVTHAVPAIQLGAKFDIREGSSCLDDDPLAAPQLVTGASHLNPDGETTEASVVLDPGDYCAIHVEAPAGLVLHYMTSPRQAFTIHPGGGLPVYFQYIYIENTPPSEEPVVVVPPGVSAGTTITFPNVIAPGVTTVTVDSNPPALPAGFTLSGAIFYEIETTASFVGNATICLPYFPGSFTNPAGLELLHHDGAIWQNVTISNDSVNGFICGSVSSFSPFAIAEPAETDPEPEPEMVISGFLNPVLMDGVNQREGGKVVNLRFTVTADGVKLTDPAVVNVTAQQVDCQSGAAIGDAIPVTSVTSNGNRFTAKWRTPEIDGCYTAAATTIDGASIAAQFELFGNPGILTLDGFLSPVSMDAVNELEGGRTVNVRFYVYRDEDRSTDATAIAAFGYQQVDCETGAAIGEFHSLQETLTTVNNRFKTTWTTPEQDGCFTLRAEVAGGDAIEADYLLYGNSHLYELGDGFLPPIAMGDLTEHEGGRNLNIRFKVTLDGDIVSDPNVVTQLYYAEVDCISGAPLNGGMTGDLRSALTFGGNRFQAQWATPEIDTCFLVTAATEHESVSAIIQLNGNPGVMSIEGFLSPVVMDAVNSVEDGKPVSLRFRVYRDEDRQSDLALISSLTYRQVDCADSTVAMGDPVEIGGLTYTSNRFQTSWTTPEIDGCFVVRVEVEGAEPVESQFELWGNSGLSEVSTFLGPVMMDQPNVYAAGTKVWLRFAVALNGDVISDLSKVASLTYTPVSCSDGTNVGSPVDINGLAFATNKFQVRWTTPSTPGCLAVSATTVDDVTITSWFELT